MGAGLDCEIAYPPNTHPATMRRERREAKRRMVLLSLLGSLFFLTVVAFRRSNSFVSDYTYQSTNTTYSASRINSKGKSWLTGKLKSTGPVLSNNGRCLSDSSLTALKNSSLGVSEVYMVASDYMLLMILLSIYIVREGFRPQHAITYRQA